MEAQPQGGAAAAAAAAAEETTSSSSPMATLLPLASDSQQPYVSELLSFTLDRLHKVTPSLRSLKNKIIFWN